MNKFKAFLCRIGIHSWDYWGKRSGINDRGRAMLSTSTQTRNCKRCNVVEDGIRIIAIMAQGVADSGWTWERRK
jgi:hypothetical protein